MATDSSKRKTIKGVSRIDSAGTHGWFVRVYQNGKTYSKLFSDGKHGGRKEALANAMKHRDTMTVQLEWRRQRQSEPSPRCRSNTGIRGVSKTHKRNRDGSYTGYYSVSWVEHGVHKCKTFAIPRYGDERALQLAKQFRKEKEQRMEAVRQQARRAKVRDLLEDSSVAV